MSHSADTASRKPRRLPVPIETSSRSSRKHQDNKSEKINVHLAQAGTQIHKIETNSSKNELIGPSPILKQREPGHLSGFAANRNNEGGFTETTHSTFPPAKTGHQQQDGPRKFTPQLMETARHSFRPRRNYLSHENSAAPKSQGSGDAGTASDSMANGLYVMQESRFSYSSLLRRQETRRHSFRVPDLPAIPSSGSEGSNETDSHPQPSLPSAACRGFEIPTDAMDQSAHGREAYFSEYVTPLTSHSSETQLKEQALAAFPNEQVYQPVDHFAIDRDEDESPYEETSALRDPRFEFRKNRRASSADLPLELEYLRRHKEKAGMNRHRCSNTRRGRFSHVTRQSSRSMDKAVNRDGDLDVNRTHPRQAASPPMLGGDLVFPQSSTPETTVCEGNHTIGSDEGRDLFSGLFGLWSASPRSSAHDDHNGLWHGTCKLDSHSIHGTDTLLPGLITPKLVIEADAWKSLHEPPMAGAQRQLDSHLAVHSLGGEFSHKGYTDQEFNDGFVTQIYNYLSLGYPSVARYYDHELSKVSGVPVATLRANDLNTDAKGYVGVQQIADSGAANDVCMRWTALRLYVQEWARQQPQMLEADHYHETWGVRERKGSWAV